MKTPEQIAEQAAQQVLVDNLDSLRSHVPDDASLSALGFALGDGIDYEDGLEQLVARAIEADRAQRGIIAQVAEVLGDRGAHAAAQLVRDTDPDDDLWNNYIGPMIDSIEDDYTGMAKEINA